MEVKKKSRWAEGMGDFMFRSHHRKQRMAVFKEEVRVLLDHQ
jgi:hypothetical protein